MHQLVALEGRDSRLEAGRQRVHFLEFGRCREVVGPIVESGEQNSLRLLEDEWRAVSSFGDQLSDHRGERGVACRVMHAPIIVQDHWNYIASLLEPE